MLRTIGFFLVVIIFLILGLFFWLIMGIIYLFNKKLAFRWAFACIRCICTIGREIAGVRLTARGLENLPGPKDGPVLYVMNHRGIFDIIVSYSLMKAPAGFIAKKELRKIPLFATWIELNHGLFIDRNDIRQGLKTILKGIEYLKNGYSMCIFPEGTRNKHPEEAPLGEFHAGSFKLAEKANVPIIPVAITGTDNCFENHKPFMKAADVKITFCEPIDTASLSKEERRFLCSRVYDVIQGVLLQYDEEDAAAAED